MKQTLIKKGNRITAFILALAVVFTTALVGVPLGDKNGEVKAASTSSGTYYGIPWTMDAKGNLTLKGGTCSVTICNICGQEVYRTGDEKILQVGDGSANTTDYIMRGEHLKNAHGYPLHSYEELMSGVISTNEWFTNEFPVLFMNFVTTSVPGYEETVMHGHWHCNDCGKDY